MSTTLEGSGAWRPQTTGRESIAVGVSAAIGRTPLVRLDRLFPESGIEILAKLESANPGGGTKDRPALAMVRDAMASGRLRPGGTVVESSSGNLGVALARVCLEHAVRFVCVVDSRTNGTAVAAIRALGGRIEMVTDPDPETGDLLTARLRRVERLLSEIPGAVNLHQYGNPANPAAHEDGTMREIAEATGHRLDVLMAAVSTTGTLAGCAPTSDAPRWTRPRSPWTRKGACCSEGPRPLALCPVSAPEWSRTSPARSTRIESSASAGSTAWSARDFSPSARASSPAPRREASCTRWEPSCRTSPLGAGSP
uniref:pyridoxal-phosphate dependent enzyme n=1 Tax=Brachybacterium sp. GPGPB12 TaxID=3023517 RepID=UPI00404B3E53